ncbi:MAG: hypothetical protein ACLFNU_11615 [Bacteroidales bacterium]
MFTKKSFRTAINIYLLTLLSLAVFLTNVYTDFFSVSIFFWVFFGVIFIGWFYFLFHVTTTRWLRFDAKMAWFIAMFSFYFIAAPLFAFIVLKNNHQK